MCLVTARRFNGLLQQNSNMWLILAPLTIMVTLLAIVLSPILALFVQDDNRLPNYLNWFQTPDNLIIGDDQFRSEQMSWTKSKYLYALFWLARNPAYGFDSFVGIKINPGFIYHSKGDEKVGNVPLHEGWVYRTLRNTDGTKAWQFYLIKRLTNTKCLKLNFGWKLWSELKVGQIRSLAVTCNPFTKYVV